MNTQPSLKRSPPKKAPAEEVVKDIRLEALTAPNRLHAHSLGRSHPGSGNISVASRDITRPRIPEAPSQGPIAAAGGPQHGGIDPASAIHRRSRTPQSAALIARPILQAASMGAGWPRSFRVIGECLAVEGDHLGAIFRQAHKAESLVDR